MTQRHLPDNHRDITTFLMQNRLLTASPETRHHVPVGHPCLRGPIAAVAPPGHRLTLSPTPRHNRAADRLPRTTDHRPPPVRGRPPARAARAGSAHRPEHGPSGAITPAAPAAVHKCAALPDFICLTDYLMFVPPCHQNWSVLTGQARPVMLFAHGAAVITFSVLAIVLPVLFCPAPFLFHSTRHGSVPFCP